MSRGAPYRHFADKEGLLTTVATEGWMPLGDHMHEVQRFVRLGDSEHAHTQCRGCDDGLVSLHDENPGQRMPLTAGPTL
ncbi:hypothetical protein [Mycolicibacterium mengxianglii]|uniref:hypothetical protein n=1 Tax=Mycolicibacterium mengxianglii TaxID=2736649 RepID=UPI0038CC1513